MKAGFYRIAIASFAALLFVGAGGDQNTISLTFLQSPSRNTRIGAFMRHGLMYGSLNDLLASFKISARIDTGLQRIEFQSNGSIVRVLAGNPYVAVQASDGSTDVHQLASESVFAAGAYFVPIEQFLPVFDRVMAEEITLDDNGENIIVGKAPAKSPYDITGLSMEEKENGVQVRIKAQRPIKDFERWLKPDEGFTWLYLTIAGLKVDQRAVASASPAGLVESLQMYPSTGSMQFTFKLKGTIDNVDAITEPGSNDLLIEIYSPQPEVKQQPSPSQSAPVQPPPAEQQPAAVPKDTGSQVPAESPASSETTTGGVVRQLERERNRWALDCIVIDAGHGGEDPGTIGVTRVKEKDVTLGIALKLGNLIEKELPGVRVVYTRKTDVFIELYKRGQIANAAGGKLFISIHCNSVPHKPSTANGFEIYLLRPGKTENALRIAERENSVVKLEKDYEQRYQDLTEEHFILLTMAQSAYVKYSEQFADILQHEMSGRVDLQNNGLKQAGFYVLVGASMPNVLVETAYLSNRHDEKILKSDKGQEDIAKAIFAGIKKYKQEYEKSLKEGND
jgi:N-acetylmuramoyl-L-alanine amidase